MESSMFLVTCIESSIFLSHLLFPFLEDSSDCKVVLRVFFYFLSKSHFIAFFDTFCSNFHKKVTYENGDIAIRGLGEMRRVHTVIWEAGQRYCRMYCFFKFQKVEDRHPIHPWKDSRVFRSPENGWRKFFHIYRPIRPFPSGGSVGNEGIMCKGSK